MTERPALRSQRLNQITHAPHTELDALVKAHAPFDSRENFARFVVAQYLFQSELQALYTDPQLIAIVPDLAELDIAARMIPAKEVGGDFYDFFPISEHKVAVVIADVSGKGVPAAMFIAIARSPIKAVAPLPLL